MTELLDELDKQSVIFTDENFITSDPRMYMIIKNAFLKASSITLEIGNKQLKSELIELKKDLRSI